MATWAIGDVTVIRIEEQIGFASLPAPGHTRGHVALWLANTAGHALFSGDVMHHALQIHAPLGIRNSANFRTLRGQRAGS